jgi:hypothetical protein
MSSFSNATDIDNNHHNNNLECKKININKEINNNNDNQNDNDSLNNRINDINNNEMDNNTNELDVLEFTSLPRDTDDDRYILSFDVNTDNTNNTDNMDLNNDIMNDALRFYNEYGFVVFRNVFTKKVSTYLTYLCIYVLNITNLLSIYIYSSIYLFLLSNLSNQSIHSI